MKIASIDFETANHADISICAAAVATFDNGELTESLYWLVRPPATAGDFHPRFTECHGLTRSHVKDAPEFPEIALQFFASLAAAEFVIAHRAVFDTQKLRATAKHFGLKCPKFNYLCTLKAARKVWPELVNHQLNTVAAHVGHKFKHHHAQEDAEAAGQIVSAMAKKFATQATDELVRMIGVDLEIFLPE